jgi:hypothetical protein
MAAMTATELMPAVGQQVSVRFEDCQVFCTVLDAKCSYGRPRLLIQPISGDNSQWVELSRISRIEHTTTSKSAGITPALEAK